MGLRVKDGGGSEGRAVMVRIGVAPAGNITPRESVQTSPWSGATREPGQQTSGGDADMSAAATLAGAAPIPGNRGCLLQAGIVEVSSGKRGRAVSVRPDRPVVQFFRRGSLELPPRPTGKQRHTKVEPDRTVCPEVAVELPRPPSAARAGVVAGGTASCEGRQSRLELHASKRCPCSS